MIKIIPPEHFKKSSWKNGKGETTELAISKGGTLEAFDWRISMAKVVEDGAFSQFAGYVRNLILIEGNGIELQYDQSKIDRLDQLLSFATFDGGCHTVATLTCGPITDVNVITRADKYAVDVAIYIDQQAVNLRACAHCFIYCLHDTALLTSADDSVPIALKSGHLMQIDQANGNLQIVGHHMMVVHLFEREC